MVIDTLTDLAETMGAFEDEGEDDLDLDGIDGVEDDMDLSGGMDAIPESIQAKMTKLKDGVKTLQNRNNKVKSKFTGKGGKAKNVGPGKGKCDGKIQSQGKSKFGPSMSGKAGGNSPVNKAGADLF